MSMPDKKYFEIKKAFKLWQKKYYNFMTPDLISLDIFDNNYLIELSRGTGINQNIIFGVTVINWFYDKEKKQYMFSVNHKEELNRCITTTDNTEMHANNYFDEISNKIKVWK